MKRWMQIRMNLRCCWRDLASWQTRKLIFHWHGFIRALECQTKGTPVTH